VEVGAKGGRKKGRKEEGNRRGRETRHFPVEISGYATAKI